MRHVQGTHSRDKYARLDAQSGARDHPPEPFRVVPYGFLERRGETDVRHNPVPPGAVSQVFPNLRLRRVHAAPFGIAVERKRVEMRRYVAGATGIAVLMPSTADIVVFLDHQKRL